MKSLLLAPQPQDRHTDRTNHIRIFSCANRLSSWGKFQNEGQKVVVGVLAISP